MITTGDHNRGVFSLLEGVFSPISSPAVVLSRKGWSENGQVVNIAISFNLVLCDSGGMAYNPVL
jgi:hypothetical protein